MICSQLITPIIRQKKKKKNIGIIHLSLKSGLTKDFGKVLFSATPVPHVTCVTGSIAHPCNGSMDKTTDSQPWGYRFKSVGSGRRALKQGTLSSLPSPLDHGVWRLTLTAYYTLSSLKRKQRIIPSPLWKEKCNWRVDLTMTIYRRQILYFKKQNRSVRIKRETNFIFEGEKKNYIKET